MNGWPSAERADLGRDYARRRCKLQDTPPEQTAQRGCIEWIDVTCRPGDAAPRNRVGFLR